MNIVKRHWERRLWMKMKRHVPSLFDFMDPIVEGERVYIWKQSAVNMSTRERKHSSCTLICFGNHNFPFCSMHLINLLTSKCWSRQSCNLIWQAVPTETMLHLKFNVEVNAAIVIVRWVVFEKEKCVTWHVSTQKMKMLMQNTYLHTGMECPIHINYYNWNSILQCECAVANSNSLA